MHIFIVIKVAVGEYTPLHSAALFFSIWL